MDEAVRPPSSWHIITGEYPPQHGGVSDYSRLVAEGLAAAGDPVHVWCPAAKGDRPTAAKGVEVHAIAGSWHGPDLERLNAELDGIEETKRLLVQWVPHAYGRRSLNVAFCQWIRRRARAGDRVELMVHEPFLAFREGPLRQDAAAAVHRIMVALLLSRAQGVWVAIPAWSDRLRPWTLGRDIPFQWLPVPSNVPVRKCDGAVSRRRAELLRGSEGIVLGHFSTYSPGTRRLLQQLIPKLLALHPDLRVQLLGRGSEEMIDELLPAVPTHAGRVFATGPLTGDALSACLQSCDLMMQPYPDGASTRRGTLMAALAHGLPVVTTAGRLTETFWRDSDAAAVVSAGDDAAFVREISSLATDPARRRRIGDAARLTYEARFSVARLVTTLRAGLTARVQ